MPRIVPALAICIMTVLGLALTSAIADEEVIFRSDRPLDVSKIEARDVRVSLVPARGGQALRVETGHKETWPGVTLRPENGQWNLARFSHVTCELANPGKGEIQVGVRLDSTSTDGKTESYQEIFPLAAGERRSVRLAITQRMPNGLSKKLFGMRGYPGGLQPEKGLDARRVTAMLLFVSRPKEDGVFEVDSIRAGGVSSAAELIAMGDEIFPLIDQYGQYIHKDWPGKIHADVDLAAAREAEAADLAAHPGPADWDRFGGWAAGPQREATGFFRVEKLDGKWWLVGPEGRLFWSHGADCVRDVTGATPITDREHYFQGLPTNEPPYDAFYGRGRNAAHGYYENRAYATFNFTGVNLLRKYGSGWKGAFAEISHRRLRSWGMNTIANWSDPAVYRLRRTPYTATVGSGGRRIEGSSGYWGKFPDPFDAGFRQALDARMAGERGSSAGDAWCIGYFVDNELGWGEDLSLALAALASPADQPAKRAMLAELKAKYGAIEQLNAAWGTGHSSWDALAAAQTPPDKEKAGDDLAAFHTRIAEEYFRHCREAVKAVAPEQLYLGCRFAWANDRAIRAAAKYCDVVSFNKYAYTVADFSLPKGVDKPAIIGEFHFGALDRGMFHTGLKPVADQEQRAATYKSYVEGAIKNPWLVGTHWFQFGEQATTGRSDGENYQIGLLDIADTPYPETIGACREVGQSLYRLRSEQ